MKTLAILTNGGDTCALNASIRSIRDNAYQAGYKKIYGVRRGYQGLLDSCLEDITHKEIDPKIGGSCLGSLRISPTDKIENEKLLFSTIFRYQNEFNKGVLPSKLWQEFRKHDIELPSKEMVKVEVKSQNSRWRIYFSGNLGYIAIKEKRKLLVKKKESYYKINDARAFEMAKCLKDYRIDVLVVIGGDGTLQATRMFQDWVQTERALRKLRPFEIIGFLKTIDNDIRTFTNYKGVEVSLCPGFPSAVRKIVSSVEDLRVTVRTAERAFSIETMGRDAGWLAAAATYGGAEILLVPEHKEIWKKLKKKDGAKELAPEEVPTDILHTLVEAIADFYAKNRNVLIAVAEGFEPGVTFPEVEKFNKVIYDLYGTRKKVGATELVALLVSPVLEYYFQILSNVCQANRRSYVSSALNDALLKTKAKSSAWKKYQDKVSDPQKSHPLRNWNVENRLKDQLLGFKTRQTAKILKSNTPASSQDAESGDEELHLAAPPYQFEIRPHRTDYLPRSGSPSSYDYRLATVLGQKVGEMLRDNEFGGVPALEQVVPYEELTLKAIKTVRIEEIRTLNFGSIDYFDRDFPLQVSKRITDFFRTILSGPEDLEQAIRETQSEAKKNS